MGAALSDNFLLSPYYYSVISREEMPKDDESEFKIALAMELVKLLCTKIVADMSFLISMYKRWETEGGELEAIRDKRLINFFDSKLKIKDFWPAWLIMVIATPVVDVQTKLWILFNVAYRRYKRVRPGAAPGNYMGNRGTTNKNDKKDKKKDRSSFNSAGVLAVRNNDLNETGRFDEAAQTWIPVDTRKFPLERNALEHMITEVFAMLSDLLEAKGACLTVRQVGSLIDRSEFQIFPIKVEQAVTILKEDATFNAITRLFATFFHRQKDEIFKAALIFGSGIGRIGKDDEQKGGGNFSKMGAAKLPTPYVGPMDFALDADWTDMKLISKIIPKTVFHSGATVPPQNEVAVKLSVCEICFLNVIKRMINTYIDLVYDTTSDGCYPRDAQGNKLPMMGSTQQAIERKQKQWRKRRKKYVKAKLAFLIRRCVAGLRSLCEMVRFQLPANFRPHMENISTVLTKKETPFQQWIVKIFQAVYKLSHERKSTDATACMNSTNNSSVSTNGSGTGTNGTNTTSVSQKPPYLTLKDVTLGLVGRECDDDLANQIVYIAENSLLESHQVLNQVPLLYRKMLTYGTADAIPIDDSQKHSKLSIGDLIRHQLVDEVFCRDLMDESGLTEYDTISKEKYLASFIPSDYVKLCSDEFDRVVAHRFMEDRADEALDQEGVLIPKPNSQVVTLSQLRYEEFALGKKLIGGQRRKDKLLKLKEKVEADLEKELELEAGLKESMDSMGTHCLALMEKIRIDDNYDRESIMLNKYILARYYEEKSKREEKSKHEKKKKEKTLPPLVLRGTGEDTGPGKHMALSARGKIRKERKSLSPHVLLQAEDLNARRRRRRKRMNNLFKSSLTDTSPTTIGGQNAVSLRQQIANRLGMAYLPPELLGARVDNLKQLANLERIDLKFWPVGRQYDNTLFYSKYGLKISGKDKIHFVPRRAAEMNKELKQVMRTVHAGLKESSNAQKVESMVSFLADTFGAKLKSAVRPKKDFLDAELQRAQDSGLLQEGQNPWASSHLSSGIRGGKDRSDTSPSHGGGSPSHGGSTSSPDRSPERYGVHLQAGGAGGGDDVQSNNNGPSPQDIEMMKRKLKNKLNSEEKAQIELLADVAHIKEEFLKEKEEPSYAKPDKKQKRAKSVGMATGVDNRGGGSHGGGSYGGASHGGGSYGGGIHGGGSHGAGQGGGGGMGDGADGSISPPKQRKTVGEVLKNVGFAGPAILGKNSIGAMQATMNEIEERRAEKAEKDFKLIARRLSIQSGVLPVGVRDGLSKELTSPSKEIITAGMHSLN